MPKMVVFLSEARERREVVAHLSRQRVFDPEVDIDRVSTMNNRQRQIVNSGVLELNGHDHANRLCFNLHTTNDVDRQTPCVRENLEVPDAACLKVQTPAHLETAREMIDRLTQHMMLCRAPNWSGDQISMNTSSNSKRSLSECTMFCILLANFLDGGRLESCPECLVWYHERGNLSFVMTNLLPIWSLNGRTAEDVFPTKVHG